MHDLCGLATRRVGPTALPFAGCRGAGEGWGPCAMGHGPAGTVVSAYGAGDVTSTTSRTRRAQASCACVGTRVRASARRTRTATSESGYMYLVRRAGALPSSSRPEHAEVGRGVRAFYLRTQAFWNQLGLIASTGVRLLGGRSGGALNFWRAAVGCRHCRLLVSNGIPA